MWKNTIIMAYRILIKQKLYSLINILGLSIGLASALMILLYVKDELSYDRYHENHDRIYRLSREWFNDDGVTNLHLGHLAPAFAPLLYNDFDEWIEEAVRMVPIDAVVRFDDKIFREDKLFFSDPSVFNVFSWKMLEGDPDNALRNPDGLVITQSTAHKFFGNTDPMGKQMEIIIGSFRQPMIVRGIVEDVPSNSHFQFDILASFQPVINFFGGEEAILQNFGNNSFSTFILLKDNSLSARLENELTTFVDKHVPPLSSGATASSYTKLHLWPLSKIHLYSNLDSEIEPNSNIEYVYVYSAIALFILLIACINFMNLSTARSSVRAMEVGLRKVMGASRPVLIKQFMGESIFLVFISMVLALVFVYYSLPWFSSFTGKEFSIQMISDPGLIFWVLLLLIGVGCISGSYPALFLSGFQPVKVLKGTFKIGSIHEKLRSGLVVVQFAITIGLIASLLIVTGQLDYMKNKDLGYHHEDMIVLDAPVTLTNQYELMYNRITRNPAIVDMAISSRMPSTRLLDSQGATAEVGGNMVPISFRLADIHVSHTFGSTFDLELKSGRDFDVLLASDSLQSFILNENAVAAIGWSSAEEALGKQLNYGPRQGQVIGVYKDFHFESLHQPITPMVFMIARDRFNEWVVRARPGQKNEAIAFLKTEWEALNPEIPFEYDLINDRIIAEYDADEKVKVLFGGFALLAIFISIIGLVGMASFATERRTREIGIRKVLGASVWNILAMLEKQFVQWILIGLLLSVPFVWYGMSTWLDRFTYKISITPWPMIVAGAIATLIAVITIGVFTWKAASENPVNTIKSD